MVSPQVTLRTWAKLPVILTSTISNTRNCAMSTHVSMSCSVALDRDLTTSSYRSLGAIIALALICQLKRSQKQPSIRPLILFLYHKRVLEVCFRILTTVQEPKSFRSVGSSLFRVFISEPRIFTCVQMFLPLIRL